EQSARAQVENPGDPFALIHPVHAEHAEKGQQDPGKSVVDGAGLKAHVGLAVHRRDQEQIDDPADEQQAEREEPDGAGHRLAVIEAVRAEKAEYPQEIANQGAVCVLPHLNLAVWWQASESAGHVELIRFASFEPSAERRLPDETIVILYARTVSRHCLMQLIDKLSVLADAAKYDVSCASSGAPKRSSKGRSGLGATDGMGICHSFTPDGRCVALLKVLLTNFCLYDCQYCVNRRSSDVPRARFTPEEVVTLTLDFYRRNCISGLFLSSGIIRSADYTMEQLNRVARLLREEHEFRGYIHLKTIPDADPLLIAEAGRYADRLSVNIELPTESSLIRLAPEKQVVSIKQAMHSIHQGETEAQAEKRAPRFAPAGQSTQMIVGADATDDSTILHSAQ